MLRKSIIKRARHYRAGKQVERGVSIADFMLPVIYGGPRDMAGLWGGGKSKFLDLRSVRVTGGGRIDWCRPIFREWLIEAEVILDPEAIDLEKFTARCSGPGKWKGSATTGRCAAVTARRSSNCNGRRW